MRALRLHALAQAPLAFGSTLAREEAFTDELWHERAAGAAAGCERATFVAELDGQWMGLATGMAQDTDPLLISMFVDNRVRRLGVGALLVEAVAAWARECGAASLSLWVTSGNEPAATLYRRCGFQPTGTTRPLAHTPALSECEMRRALR